MSTPRASRIASATAVPASHAPTRSSRRARGPSLVAGGSAAEAASWLMSSEVQGRSAGRRAAAVVLADVDDDVQQPDHEGRPDVRPEAVDVEAAHEDGGEPQHQ